MKIKKKYFSYKKYLKKKNKYFLRKFQEKKNINK